MKPKIRSAYYVKYLYVCLFFLIFASTVRSQNYSLNWAHNPLDSTLNDQSVQILKSYVDSVNSKIYIFGEHGLGNVDLDVSPNISTTPMYYDGMFLAKYDADGTFIWGYPLRFGTACNGITVDNNQNVIIVGSYTYDADFDAYSSSGILVNQSNQDDPNAFIAKYDLNGNYISSRQISSTYNGASCEATGVDVDQNGNVYVSGNFNGITSFNYPGPGPAVNLASTATDVFFAKYDPNLNVIWVKKIDALTTTNNNKIKLDLLGNFYLSGNFNGVLDFLPTGTAFTLTPTLNTNSVYISKFDLAGNFQWAKMINGNNTVVSNNFNLTEDNLYITGFYTGVIDFDPSGNTASLPTSSIDEAFIAKYDSLGNFQWVNGSSCLNTCEGIDLKVNSNSIRWVGKFKNSATFGSTGTIIAPTYYYNTFLAQLDLSGNFVSVMNIASSINQTYPTNIGLINDSTFMISGSCGGPADLNPSPQVNNLTGCSNGGFGFFSIFSQNSDLTFVGQLGSEFCDDEHDDLGIQVAVDPFGNKYMLGSFSGTKDFDPNSSFDIKTSSGLTDVFVSKFTPAGQYLWTINFGGVGNMIPSGITFDSYGNMIVSGFFDFTCDFDPSASTNLLTPISNEYDLFYAKYDNNGAFLWANSIATNYSPGNTMGQFENSPVAFDLDNNFFITGTLTYSSPFNTVDFDPSPNTATITLASGNYKSFLAKYDNDGNFLWVQQLGYNTNATGNYCFPNLICVNQSNEVILAGGINGIVDFDNSMNTANATGRFIVKYNNNGAFLNLRSLNPSTISDLKIGSQGDVHITGYFNGISVNFGGGVPSLISSYAYSSDAYIAKYDSNLVFQWVKKIGGEEADFGYSIALDFNDNVFLTGKYAESADFNPSNSVSNVLTNTSPYGGTSVWFIAKYTSNGSYVWASQIESTEVTPNRLRSMICTGGGELLATGDFSQFMDVDPSANGFYLSSRNGIDAYIMSLQVCTPTSGIETIVTCNPYLWIDGNIYDQSNNSATYTLVNSGGCDSIVSLNLTINSTVDFDTVVACSQFTWIDGVTYFSSSDSIQYTVVNSLGCDSSVFLNLTINQADSSMFLVQACDSFTWIDGLTYYDSNNSTQFILTNQNGCDSIVSLNLILNQSQFVTDSITSCVPFTWIDGNTYSSSNNTATYTMTTISGCDSIINLNLQINQPDSIVDFVSSCEPYTWIDGTTYTSSNNTASYLLTNSFGCDSIIYLNLIITTIDNSVEVNNSNLISANMPLANYQWLNCANNFSEINNENNQFFSALNNGEYAVEITFNGCIDTSNCVVINNADIEKLDSENVSVYPNPTNDYLMIKAQHSILNVAIMDAYGKEILNEKKSTDKLNVSMLADGIYFLKINFLSSEVIIPFVKN